MRARVPYVDWIWRVQSSLDLDESMTAGEAFQRLDPLFEAQGTEVSIAGNTLTYQKTNPAAQDKLATFTSGSLTVENEEGASRLDYDVASTALFLCFLAPLAFLAFGQFADFINQIEKPGLIAEKELEEKQDAEKGDEDKEALELHWIDQMLGATVSKESGEDDETSRDERSALDNGEEEDEIEGNHSPTTAYVFAGIFFAIYLVGRVLEPYLLKRTFRAALSGASSEQNPDSDADTNFGSRGSQPSETSTSLEFGT